MGPLRRRSWIVGSKMSTGRRVEGLLVLRESRMSEVRMRKRAVWVRALRGMVREVVVEVRKVVSQVGETGRDLVVRRWVVIWE